MRRFCFSLLMGAAMALIVGCTSVTGSKPGGTTPTQPAGAQFTESMLVPNGSGTVAGQVVMNQNGSGTMTLSGTAPNTSYAIQFCPFADPNAACNTITTTTSSMAGAVSATFTFPVHGGFAGIFQASSGTQDFVSGFNVPVNGSILQAPLVRASTVANGLGTEGQLLGIGFDPLTSGLVNVSSGEIAHFEVHGAAPSQTYSITFCRNGGGSSCFAVGAITTDASGNGSGDFQLGMSIGVETGDAGVFLLATGKPPAIQFVSGFTVP